MIKFSEIDPCFKMRKCYLRAIPAPPPSVFRRQLSGDVMGSRSYSTTMPPVLAFRPRQKGRSIVPSQSNRRLQKGDEIQELPNVLRADDRESKAVLGRLVAPSGPTEVAGRPAPGRHALSCLRAGERTHSARPSLTGPLS